MLSISALKFLVGVCVLSSVVFGDAKVPLTDTKIDSEIVAEPLANSRNLLDQVKPLIRQVVDNGEKHLDDLKKNIGGHGFFSIVFLKKTLGMSEPNNNQEQGDGSIDMKPPQSLILFKIHPSGQHLLGGGGENDIDQKYVQFKAKENEGLHMLGADDLDRIRGQMVGNGGEDTNEQVPPQQLFPGLPFFDFFKNGKRPYLMPKREHDEDDSNEDQDRPMHPSLLIRTDLRDDQEEQSSSSMVRKCMMQHFMRLKASLYYRSVLHMLFISGVLLFALLSVMLMMRSCRRARQMRQYSQAMNVSAIDTKLAMGANMPPAYEQLVGEKKLAESSAAARTKFRSPLVNSLAQAYRNRYSVLVNNSTPTVPSDGDNVSVSSLPNYEEHTKKNVEHI